MRRAKKLNTNIEFPLTLGRDFSGVIVSKGHGISDDKLQLGDEVWGVVPVDEQGCHASHVIIDESLVFFLIFQSLSSPLMNSVKIIIFFSSPRSQKNQKS